MQVDITFLELLKMVFDDVQPNEVYINKNIYRWTALHKDYYNIETGYSLGAEIQQVIPFEIANLVSKKVISYDRDILTNQEKDYLATVLYPYKDKVDYVQKIAIEQKENSDYRLVIAFNDENPNMLMPTFAYNSEEYKNMRAGQHYTLEDLKIYKE